MANGLSEAERFELGQILGDAIASCFAVIAKLDGISLRETMDDWVASYFADRVANGDE